MFSKKHVSNQISHTSKKKKKQQLGKIFSWRKQILTQFNILKIYIYRLCPMPSLWGLNILALVDTLPILSVYKKYVRSIYFVSTIVLEISYTLQDELSSQSYAPHTLRV